jgi:RNA polymerase sigma-70 factor (ECF subfamily)
MVIAGRYYRKGRECMTDKQLIALIAKNADSGLRTAIDLYGNNVYAVCRSVLSGCGSEAIEEAWSDTFFKLWKYAHNFDPDRDVTLKTYICTIARNASLRCRDKEKHVLGNTPFEVLETDDIIDNSIDVENDFVRGTIDNGIREAVKQMEEPEKSVFILRYFYFFKVKEIAEATRLTAKQVENLLSRKKQVLKDILYERGIFANEYL